MNESDLSSPKNEEYQLTEANRLVMLMVVGGAFFVAVGFGYFACMDWFLGSRNDAGMAAVLCGGLGIWIVVMVLIDGYRMDWWRARFVFTPTHIVKVTRRQIVSARWSDLVSARNDVLRFRDGTKIVIYRWLYGRVLRFALERVLSQPPLLGRFETQILVSIEGIIVWVAAVAFLYVGGEMRICACILIAAAIALVTVLLRYSLGKLHRKRR